MKFLECTGCSKIFPYPSDEQERIDYLVRHALEIRRSKRHEIHLEERNIPNTKFIVNYYPTD